VASTELPQHQVFLMQLFNLTLNLVQLVRVFLFFASHALNDLVELADGLDALGLALASVFFGLKGVVFVGVREVRTNFDFNLLLCDFEVLLVLELLLAIFSDLQHDQQPLDDQHFHARDVQLVAKTHIQEADGAGHNGGQRHRHDCEKGS
jgi:hypothetical protein